MFPKLKRPAIAVAGILSALMLLPAALVSAAPAPPELSVGDVVDQAGYYDGVSTYNAAWVDISIANSGTSNYTQVRLTVKPVIEGTTNVDTTVAARAALDGSVGVPTSSQYCTLVSNWFECSLPSVPGPGQSPVIRFVFSSSTGASFDVSAFASIKELTNTGGSNQDRDATDSELIDVNVSARADKQTPFLPAGQPFTISTWKQGNVGGQKATLALPSSANAYLVDLQEFLPGEEPTLPAECSAVSGGIGQLVSADVNGGATISPYLQWTLELTLGKGVPPENPSGVTHCTDPDGDGVFVETFISVQSSDQCSASKPVNCLVWSKGQPFTTKVTGNKANANYTYTFVVRTPTNGFTGVRK